MLIPNKAKIEAVCSKDETRAHLCAPYLDLTDKERPCIVATDGHAMVALDVQASDGDSTGWVSIDALKAVRKAGPRAELVCNGSCATPAGTFPRPLAEGGFSYPDWRQVMPKEREGERVIAFDVNLLKKIVDACGGKGGVRMYITGDNLEPFRIEVMESDATHRAVLMPMRP